MAAGFTGAQAACGYGLGSPGDKDDISVGAMGQALQTDWASGIRPLVVMMGLG